MLRPPSGGPPVILLAGGSGNEVVPLDAVEVEVKGGGRREFGWRVRKVPHWGTWLALFISGGRLPCTGPDAKELLEGVQDEGLGNILAVQIVTKGAFTFPLGPGPAAVLTTLLRLSGGRGGGTVLTTLLRLSGAGGGEGGEGGTFW